jgi:PAS domain S-box-containing protein
VWVLVTVGVIRGPDGEPSAVVAQVQDIDARKKAEDALRASEQQFREFAENLPGVAWLCDAHDARPLFVSSRFEELYGRPVADLHEDPFVWYRRDVVPEDRPRVREAMAAVPARPYEAEYRVRRADGSVRWVHDRAMPVRDAAGAIHRMAGFAQDVTARKVAEEARRASEERYRRLVSMLPDAVVVLGEDGRIAEANRMAASLCGVEAPSDVVGRSLFEVFDETDARAHVDEIVTQGVSVDGVVGTFARRSDGARLALEICATPFAEGGGATLLVLRDITAHLDAEAEVARQREELAAVVALREQDARLRQIIDMVPHFIFAKDAGGRFLLVNRAVADAFGTTVAELEGKTDADFVDAAEEVEQFRAADQEVLASGRPKLIPEEMLTDAAGRVRVLSTIKIPFSFAGSGVAAILGVSTDITEQKALERQLVHAQKMEGMGRLAGGIAHDFNNALSAILSFAELLAGELAADVELQKDAQAIRDVALHAAELTRQLLAFSRLGEAKPAAVDVAELTQKLSRVLLHLVGHDVTLDVLVEPGAHIVTVDPSGLEQVLVNLAINARDAMPDGGRLAIRVRTVTDDDVRPHVGGHASGGSWVELSVEDTGRGMDEATMARIFEPFFTTKAVGKGTGLGLATSYGIVQQAGGHLLVESTPNVGSVFRVLLRASEEAVASSRATRVMTANGDEVVLVVDDNQFVRETTTRALRRAGYRVVACGTAQEALSVLAEPRTRVDLVLTDVVMPEMSGFDVAMEALRLRPGVRILFVSGYGTDVLDDRSDLRGRARMLAKPFTATSLAQEVRSALDGEPVSARSAEPRTESGAPPAHAAGRETAS